jgi:hypothetical protein
MKVLFQGVLLLLASLFILLIPWRSDLTGAYPGNLYTSSGQWSKPADPTRIFYCIRTEYGLGLSWLVYDQGRDVDAWYIKVNAQVLFLHAVLAISSSIGGVYMLRRRALQKHQVIV